MARSNRPLSIYRSKRDFQKTGEPKGIGTNKVDRSDHLRFVIQKHDATRLHYDLRLELGGVFKSWAVTRGPSLDPADKRLAVEVEDHPLEYGDFEGTIPEGEYGGGTVMIWDRGYWSPETSASPIDSLRKGELKFILAGHKLQGSFVLVRTNPKATETKSNWLLIKHRDMWATPGKDTIQSKSRSVASARTMLQIAKGTGVGAAPFMTAGTQISAAAVWDASATVHANQCAAMRLKAKGTSLKPEMPRLTHPERVLWPGAEAQTKQELAEYLLAVAPAMVRCIYGRPCSFLRTPDGIEGEHFFQRHPMKGQPATLAATAAGTDGKLYVQIDDAQTLVGMAQFSVIEFHPWNSAPQQPGVPGRLVFDLDPAPDVPFDAVVEAARETKAFLEKLGLVAFCKTTGGKGLHVVCPLTSDASVSWDQAKLFSQTAAAHLADAAPSRYVTTMSKKQRTGRIFIDYLRNARGATAVAPLSPRARTGATVSMPLTWAQVKKGLDPTRFTIKTVPGLLAKSRSWRDYDASARPLRTAISALVGLVR